LKRNSSDCNGLSRFHQIAAQEINPCVEIEQSVTNTRWDEAVAIASRRNAGEKK
jgi:hypothetical protein